MGAPTNVWTMLLADEAATLRLAQRLAADLRPGDLVTLTGDLGAGKTTFARALIRTRAKDPALDVPSPTYTLLQTYDMPDGRIVHADLYRIADISEMAELGWEETAENAIVICEWADRAGEILAGERLDICLTHVPGMGNARQVRLSAYGVIAERMARSMHIWSLLERAGLGTAERHFMFGDASSRAYEKVIEPTSGQSAILMISPRRPDGPPIRGGKSYSQIAHLAESVDSFIGMARGLIEQGFSAPAILGADREHGLLLVENLGDAFVAHDGKPVPERYAVAAEVLAELHARVLPGDVTVEGGVTHRIPPFDLEAMTIEVELLLDWYFPHALRRTPSAATRLSFVDAWVSVLEPVIAGEKTWALRDYHSPNLLWLPEREGLRRIGIIDFQDCVIGPPAYDVASLLQDARVTVDEGLELQLLALYARRRRARDPDFDLSAFTAAYAVMGAQRATKVLGIFVRLDKRDGKPSYLKHIPRIEAYLRRCLGHPALAKLRQWYVANLPFMAEDAAGSATGSGQDDSDIHPRNGSGGGAGQPDAPAHADAPQAVD